MLKVRKMDADMISACAAANNQRLVDGISTFFHLTAKEVTNRPTIGSYSVTRDTIVTAAATTFEEAIALANELKAAFDGHFTDEIAHDTASSAAVTIEDATDTATGATLMNELKANLNTHNTASNVHYTNDDTNTVTAADATTDLTEYVALANDLKEQFNDHIISAPAGTWIEVVPA